MGRWLTEGKRDMEEKLQEKKKILQIQGLIRYSVSLLNAEFDLFVFTDCRPFILTHGLVKIDTKGKYLNIFVAVWSKYL